MAKKGAWIPATVEDRITVASEKTDRLCDHITDLIALHEANAIIVYSPQLSSQIPHSYAANAFNVFQRSSHFFELLRLCAHWDSSSKDRDSIPTIISLIDDDGVIDRLGAAIEAGWAAMDGGLGENQFGRSQRRVLVRGLKRAIWAAKIVAKSQAMDAIRNFRDKHLAHSLSETKMDQRGDVRKPKYGDEVQLLRLTISIARHLNLGIRNSDFAFDGSREMAKRHAHALWDGCKFDVSS